MRQQDTWPEVRVREIGDVFTGRTPSTRRPEFFGDALFFITPGDMHQGKHVTTTQRHLSQAGGELLRRIRLPPKSVCVSCIGWQMGETVMTSGPSFTNQQINSIVPNDKVDADYIYYSFVPRKQELLSLASSIGVRTPILNKSGFCDLRLRLPPRPTQHKIAAILSAYDDLIEKNEKRIKILEEMAQNLYREWFVKFRFPGHAKVKMVDSPLGKIPQGWGVERLGEIFDIVLGGTPSRGNLNFWTNGTVPWINSGKVNDLRVIEPSELITENALKSSSAKLMPIGTTLIAITGATLGQVSFLEIEASANQSVVGVVSKDVTLIEWLHQTIRERITGIIKHASGGAQQHINKEVVCEVIVAVPSEYISKAFRNIAFPMYRQIAGLLFKNTNLRQTRDLLLPRLISGEVDVSDLDILSKEE